MLEMKIKIEADAAVLKAIDKLTTALEKNAVNISVSQDAPEVGSYMSFLRKTRSKKCFQSLTKAV